MKTILKQFLVTAATLLVAACDVFEQEHPYEYTSDKGETDFTMSDVASILSELPIGKEQVREVFDAVNSSSSNGYDEEYTMNDLIRYPGSGVGSPVRKSGESRGSDYDVPMRSLLEDWFRSNRNPSTRGRFPVEEYMDALAESGMQIYWPFSEDWDGETMPVITYDPCFGAESNYGYLLVTDSEGNRRVDTVYVDENYARKHPVWVVNTNNDAAFVPAEIPSFVRSTAAAESSGPAVKSPARTLRLKSVKLLRNYDSWFTGASELWFRCGGVNGFSASTEAELKLYYPSVSEFMVVVKRKDIGKEIELNSIMITDFTTQMEKLAFLVTEDDGGTRTSWECSATVKIKSKSYGFSLQIPFNQKDDIVWRGQLTTSFFQEEDVVTGRFGDLMVSFELD